ncbi:aldo/keto reductase [Thermogemmata fonticola]|uniref:Aldo/keto reductase n=1 Tax=Thermogemmata fonticola TaxID=2755323 RepID=A0A7V9AAL7_9BACT|nr:aldo/keto reductase [Thermogemmata fonticola]MBA2225261.1 aldo/keto reductase [Thermogemmata fonticola]
MKSRLFAGVPVSEVGLGCWQLGGDQWGDITESEALAVLHAAAEAGVTFLDTADVYGVGRSESLIGRFLRERGRQGFFIASKFGRFPTPGWPENFQPMVIRQHIEASLRRLGIEQLDLTQMHCLPREQLQREELWDTLRQLQREGKIARFGASVESVEEAEECLRHPDCASLQIIFNIFRQTPALCGLLERCQQRGVAIIVRLPLASGLLGGRYTPQTTFAPNDHRSFNRNGERFNVGETFAGLGFEKGLELVEQLQALVPAGLPLPQLALRWCLDHPAVTVVIPGARRPEQVRSNAAASDLPSLSPELHSRLRDFFLQKVKPHVRGPD